MSTTQPPEPEQPTHAAQRARQLRLLDRTLDIAAARLERLDPTAPDAPDLPDAEAAVIYEKLTRSMRLGILLADKLAEPIPEPKQLDPAARTAARKRIIRDVEDVINERAGTPERVENLERELLERLDAPDMELELATRTAEAIAADLCRDFGLRASNWKRRIPPEIDLLAEFAAAPPESLGENQTRLGRLNPFLGGKHDP